MFWYWNRVKQTNDAVTESSPTSITFATGIMSDGDEIFVEYFELINSNPYPIHATEHLTGGFDAIPVVTTLVDGLMSSEDKSKLNGVENGANKYVHPSTHPTSIIVESTSRRFTSDAEKSIWNTVTDKADKVYVDTELGKKANIIDIPTELSSFTKDINFDERYYTETEMNTLLGNKVDNSRVLTDVPLNAKFTDTNTTYSEISTAEIDAGTSSTSRVITGRRVQYILNKVASMISALTKSDVGLGDVDNTSDINKPISTATQTALNGKVNNSQVLTNVPAGAKFTDTIYTHPSSHSADMIVDGTTNKTYTATEKTKLSSISSGAEVNQNTFANVKVGAATISADTKSDTLELVAGTGITLTPDTTNDKITINGVNQYVHPTTHPATMITGLPASLPADGGNADTVGGFTVGVNVPVNAKFTDTNTITTINGKTGAIAKADIVALGVPSQDTVYTHPTNHPPSIITQDTNNRFVSDSEKGVWNGKQDALGFTPVNTTDSRLSDARTPLAHTHAESEITNLATDLAGKEPVISTKNTAFNKNYNTSTTNVKMDGTVAVGTQDLIARADHIHPKDTSKANLASPALTGTPTSPTATAGTNTTQIATTAFVQSAMSGAGQGDMTKVIYDTNADGVVNDSDKLGGKLPEFYTNVQVVSTQPTNQRIGDMWYQII